MHTAWGISAPNVRVLAEARHDVLAAFDRLESHLATRTYLVGDTVTAADIVVSTALVDLLREVLTRAVTAKYTSVHRWLDTLFHKPQFSAILGDVVQTTVELQPHPTALASGPGPAPAMREDDDRKGESKLPKNESGGKQGKKKNQNGGRGASAR